MKIFNTPSWSLDADDESKLRQVNKRKAQSGAFAEASLFAAQEKQNFALYDPHLTDIERGWLLSEAQLELRRGKRQERCASGFNLRTITTGVDTTMTLVEQRGYFCKRHTCAVCAVSRARKLHATVVFRYDQALERIPNLVALHLTLTQLPVDLDSLDLGIDKLHAGVRKFLKLAEIAAAVEGSFRRTEISWNPVDCHWHVHAHIILLVRGPYGPRTHHWLDQPHLVQLWGEIIGLPDFVSVNIKRVYDRETGADDPDGVRVGLIHVSKYLCKPAGLFQIAADGTYSIAPAIAAALEKGIFKRRTYAFAGVFASRWKPKR
ncbi:MAG: protein rep [Hyphomicrobiaceae bacterium]